MSDLISRKALLETIVNTPTKESGYNPVYLQGCITRQHEILDMIERMPTIEPPKGKWCDNICSVCCMRWDENMINNADDWGYFDPMPNFCPNCGADMRSSAE